MREAVTDSTGPMQQNNPSRRRLLLPGLAAAMLLAALPTSGQAPEDSCLRRTVFANVVDRDGYPIAGLTAENFQGKFLGEPVKILSVKPDSRPTRIVILLDASGSMRGKDSQHSKWKLATVVAAHVAKTFAPRSQVALLLFNDKAYVVDFSEGQEEILKYLRALQPKEVIEKQVYGATALHSAVLEAMKLLGTPEPSDMIFAIMDGSDNASQATADQVKSVLAGTGVRLFAVVFPDESARVPGPQLRPPFTSRRYAELVAASGGSFVDVPTTKKSRSSEFELDDETERRLEERLQRLYDVMTGAYKLALELSEAVDNPRNWKLELVARDGFKPEDFRLIYQRKLLPCGAAPK